MLLKNLLAEHFQYSTQKALSKNLGDGYLLAKSPVYRKIREATLKAGFKMSPKRLHDYEVLPLTQLPIILEKRIIPYSDNVNALVEIEATAPKGFNWSEIPPLKANYIMHESAHAIARNLRILHIGKIPKARGTQNIKTLILGTLIEEAYANTVECLSNLDSESEIHDEFLFKNAYIMERPKDRATLRSAQKLIGKHCLFNLLLIGYLHSNFLKIKVNDADFLNLIKYSGVKEVKDLRLLRAVFQIGLNLDPGFTQFTGSFCFRLMGVPGNIYEFLDFDFMKEMKKNRHYSEWLESLAAIIGYYN